MNWTYVIIGVALMIVGAWIAFYQDWGLIFKLGEFFVVRKETLVGGVISAIGVLTAMAGVQD